MFSGKLLRPIVVIALAALELTSPKEAEAGSAALACDQEYFMNCGTMDPFQLYQFCVTACPAVIQIVCDTETGGIQCRYNPI